MSAIAASSFGVFGQIARDIARLPPDAPAFSRT